MMHHSTVALPGNPDMSQYKYSENCLSWSPMVPPNTEQLIQVAN
jgi:hypothetical protein